MEAVQKIIHNQKLYAIIIRAEFQKRGLEFFTPSEFSQQLAYMQHPKGHTIVPHIHKMVPRTVQYTQEVLLVKRGKTRVDFYADDHQYAVSTVIGTGDVMLLCSGGHGFEMLEETEMIEVKQGPYSAEDDKVRFEPVGKEHLKNI